MSKKTESLKASTEPVEETLPEPTKAPAMYRHAACGQATLAGNYTQADECLPCPTCRSCPPAKDFTWE